MRERTEAIAGAVLWRRLDAPGHDACRLLQRGGGWTLEGAAVFSENGVPAWLTYQLACDALWRTEHGEIRGWLGGQPVELKVVRTPEGVWTLNGAVVRGLGNCLDLDLGFTPATNLLQIRRTPLGEGQAADAPVAWLDVSAGTLDILSQRHERRSETAYWYEAPQFDYAALLEVDPVGFIRRSHRDSTGHDLCWHHPELWNLLPEKVAPEVAVPPWPKFLRGCLRYRESLERELPNAPVADVDPE